MLFDKAFVGRGSEDPLAFIIEILQSSTEYSIIGKGLDGKILLWNEGARRLYGYEAEEVLGTATSEILHTPEDIAAGLPSIMIEECMRLGKWEGLLTRVRKNGQRFRTRATLTPRIDTAGEHTGYLLISHDITSEIATAEMLSQKAAELTVSNERLSALVELNQEQSKLREQLQQSQKLESVGRLAGGVAHDFNNLLTVINGYSALLLRRFSPDDPTGQLVAEIKTAGERAAALSRQLLVLSRKHVVQFQDVNVNDIVLEVVGMLGRVIGEDIRLGSVLSPALGLVQADPGQLHQVLMNLATNARDAMPAGGSLLIETANVELDEGFSDQHPEMTPGRYVELKVSDNGVGMTKEVIGHLFEPFFTTKGPGEGTGLGLAIVYGIVKQSGGSIWAYSEPGRGTTFKIYLPRIDAGAPTSEEPAHRALALHGSETILVVEDQDQLRRMAVRVLREYGYEVQEAANPEDALRHAEQYQGRIHLLVTDLVMPGMSGLDLAKRIKTHRPKMATIVMSGYSESAIPDRRVLDSACAFLAKPFSPEGLAIKVREVFDALQTTVTTAVADRESRGGPARVVVADDEPIVRAFFRTVLEDEGYEVVEASNGKQVLTEVRAGAVDLVITDLVMPEQEGIETIRALRKEVPGMGIIAMSGGFGAQFLKAALLLGADAVISKPVDAEHLAAKVAEVLRLHC